MAQHNDEIPCGFARRDTITRVILRGGVRRNRGSGLRHRRSELVITALHTVHIHIFFIHIFALHIILFAAFVRDNDVAAVRDGEQCVALRVEETDFVVAHGYNAFLI